DRAERGRTARSAQPAIVGDRLNARRPGWVTPPIPDDNLHRPGGERPPQGGSGAAERRVPEGDGGDDRSLERPGPTPASAATVHARPRPGNAREGLALTSSALRRAAPAVGSPLRRAVQAPSRDRAQRR